MEIKILQVFYGKDGLPYKDKDRQVHFPITGTGFLGASKTTKIRFYYDELDNLDETTWVAVSKLPNGKLGSRVLESYLDEELNEHYALLELDNYYTQYKGDVFISLQGYQGGVDFDYDEENSQYEIHGTPTIAATGSIKFTINYANQFVGSGETDNINFQRILAAIGTKLGMRAYSEFVEELPSVGSPDVFYVINDDPNDPNLKNIYCWNENTQHYVWVGDNTLDLNEYYTKEQGISFEDRVSEDIEEIDNKVNAIANGSPKGVFDTLEDLESAYPDGATGIYIVLEDGHWYYYDTNNSQWTDGGQYLTDTSYTGLRNKIYGNHYPYEVLELTKYDYSNNGYIEPDGDFVGLTNEKDYCTDYLPVKKGDKIIAHQYSTINVTNAISFYDESKVYVGGVLGTSNLTEGVNEYKDWYEYVVPANGFVRLYNSFYSIASFEDDVHAFVIKNATGRSYGIDIFVINEIISRSNGKVVISSFNDVNATVLTVKLKKGDIVQYKVYGGTNSCVFAVYDDEDTYSKFRNGNITNASNPSVYMGQYTQGFYIAEQNCNVAFFNWKVPGAGYVNVIRNDIIANSHAKYIENGSNTVYVAAYNSADEEKALADYVCDGTNDEVEINQAINNFKNTSGTVIMFGGDYYIDDLPYSNSDGKVAIGFPNAGVNITLKGSIPPFSPYTFDSHRFTRINLRTTDESKFSLIGVVGAVTFTQRPSLYMSNILIRVPNSSDYPCVCIDGFRFMDMKLEDLDISSQPFVAERPTKTTLCNNELVGIKGTMGSTYGNRDLWQRILVRGMHIGIAVGGEHIIMQHIICRACDYGYTFGTYWVNMGTWTHPITLINCADELSSFMPKFGKTGEAGSTDGQGGKQAITMIDFNIEWLEDYYTLGGDYAKITTPNSWVGTIHYTIQGSYGSNQKNRVDIPFFDPTDTNHDNIICINDAQKEGGSSAERQTYAPNYWQKYYDTTLNKMLVYNGTNWVDYLGNVVS